MHKNIPYTRKPESDATKHILALFSSIRTRMLQINSPAVRTYNTQ